MRARPGITGIIGPLLAVAAGACAATNAGLDPLALLDDAEALLAADDAEGARQLLESVDQDIYPDLQRARYQLLLGHATLRSGEPWTAFAVVRGFVDEFPYSDLRLDVEQLVFECGRRLSESDKRFFIFSSDRRDARTVLEHLIQRYPRTAHLADALQILGEMAFADGDYLLAHSRFRDLLQQQPDSEWAPLARFRIAMSEFRVLEGPPYDMEQMRRARNELASFLANPPERPEFVSEAQAALEVVRTWLAERHLMVADFYRTLENTFGEREHLTAAAQQYPDTEAGRTAARRLAEMDPGREP